MTRMARMGTHGCGWYAGGCGWTRTDAQWRMRRVDGIVGIKSACEGTSNMPSTRSDVVVESAAHLENMRDARSIRASLAKRSNLTIRVSRSTDGSREAEVRWRGSGRGCG